MTSRNKPTSLHTLTHYFLVTSTAPPAPTQLSFVALVKLRHWKRNSDFMRNWRVGTSTVDWGKRSHCWVRGVVTKKVWLVLQDLVYRGWGELKYKTFNNTLFICIPRYLSIDVHLNTNDDNILVVCFQEEVLGWTGNLKSFHGYNYYDYWHCCNLYDVLIIHISSQLRIHLNLL